ncbi:hypothetical protein GQ44DRAFT_765814 [Phaeosphaeriaceae sp. PMI808]|nr:hypothetical protein GQ44DRAFT_765814 [Phaeosphaeriaceae sp. PMI808]
MSVLEPEAGIFYGLCWIAVFTRFASRRILLGSWRHLQLDDYLIVLAMVTNTVLIALMHQLVQTNSNLLPPGVDVSKFSTEEIDGRIYGSKLVLVVEQMQILTIWLIKACLLIMYKRMTTVLPQHRIVVATAIYVAISFVVMEILYFAVWCRPFVEYWAVPTNSEQCSAATNHLITNAIFNISSDLIIISIPLPLLFKVRLPTKNKVVLLSVFLIGAFTIVAAVLNKYYSFMNPFGTEWTIWYLRESYTAILCANLPLIYPLIQRLFRLRNWSGQGYATDPEQRSRRTGNSAHPNWSVPKPKPAHRGTVRRTESQEIIGRSVNDERDETPQFITSAITMDVMKSPSIDTQVTWGPGDDSKKVRDPYQAV